MDSGRGEKRERHKKVKRLHRGQKHFDIYVDSKNIGTP